MSHDLEEPGKVVLRLPGGVRPAQTEGGEVLLELDEDFLPAGRGEIKTGVRRYLGLARSDEDFVILHARCLGRRRACFLTSCIEISSLFSIMSTTRQSPHICRRFSEPSPANIEWPVSMPSMLPTICRVPKGLPQRTQLNGSASLRTTSCFACAAS